MWSAADASLAESALISKSGTPNDLKVLVKLVDKVAVGVARC